MALEVSAGYKRDVLAAMEGEELEEGEACQASDSNYGSDLDFPHLDLKLTEVLGHARRDFEGGYYPERLGSKFGRYGTFLPTVPTLPPQVAPARRLSPLTPCRPPGNSSLEVAKQASTMAVDTVPDRQASSPSAKPKQVEPAGSEVKSSSITLRIKMGSEGRGKNAAIYNRLGFSSPSASEGEDDDMSGPESSPDRSPASMIEIILSHRLPPEGLLSPLPDLTLRPGKRSAKVADNGSTKKDSSKERRQSKTTKLEDDNLKDLSEDSGRKEVESERKQVQVKQEVKEKKFKSKQDDAWKPTPILEQKMPKELFDITAEEEKAPVRKEALVPMKESLPPRDGSTTKPRREEAPIPELPKETHLDKRKSKEIESEKRAKKRPKVNAFGVEVVPLKEEKKSRSEGKPPKVKEEKKKDKSSKQNIKSELPSEALARGFKDAPKEEFVSSKVRTGKLKGGKRSKETGEPLPTEMTDFSDVKFPGQSLPQPAPPPEGVPVPPVLINENWVECDDCHTWRLLPPTMDPPKQSDRWRCEMITWLPPGMNNCKVSEEASTNALYSFLGIPHPVDPLAPAAAPMPPPVTELEKSSSKQILVKNAFKPDYIEDARAKSRTLEIKPGKHASKKKEKPKKHAAEGDASRITKDTQGQEARFKDTQEKPKNKKRTSNEEILSSKKLKSDEGSSLQRGRYPQADIPQEDNFLEEDPEYLNKRRQEDMKGGRREKSDGSQRAKYEDAEREEKNSKSLRPDKGSTKGKAVRVVETKASSRLSNDGLEPRKRKGSENCSPSFESIDTLKIRGVDEARNTGEFYDREVTNWDEYNDQSSWDDGRGRRVSNGGNAAEERSRAREEKSTRKHVRSSEGRESDDSKPKVRLKSVEALKAEHEEAEADRDKRSGKEVLPRTNPSEETGRRGGAAETLEGKHDGKDYVALANNAIKAATNLKHHADRLKDETAKDIYLQAALKFLQGGALVESVSLYNDTTDLFKFCAHQYERANDMAGALLAYKCAAVARFRMALMKSSSLSRDRRELHSALRRAPAAVQATPPTGESPSSSSASDLDNLNGQMIPVDKMFSSSGKGPASPLVQGAGTVPPALQPTLARFVRNSADVFEAFEIWNKAESVLAAVVAAKVLTPDKLAALEKVGSIGFSDVEALVCLVNQALEALGR